MAKIKTKTKKKTKKKTKTKIKIMQLVGWWRCPQIISFNQSHSHSPPKTSDELFGQLSCDETN